MNLSPFRKTNVKQVAQKEQPAKKQGVGALEKGLTSVVDIIAPSSVEVDFRYIRVGDTYYSTLFTVGYPRFVSPGWIEPIIDYDSTLNISMFCYPTSSSDVLSDLRRKIGEMQATLSSDEEQGKVADPGVEAALEDALGLQEELAKGIERFFQFGFYISVSAGDIGELQHTIKTLQATLGSLLLTSKLSTLQMEEGFKSTIPMGQDRLFITRNMDTTSLASTFPFTSAVLTQNRGVMYGINQQNGSLIIFDRFSMENANEVVFGKSGAGKSYTIKLEIMRQYTLGAEVIVIDPEGEYNRLTNTLGGEIVDFSPTSPVKINPFDLAEVFEEGENQLGLKILSLHGLIKIITGELDAEHDAILDRALIETYRQKGITPDPQTQKKTPPLMQDLYKTLLGMESTPAKELAYRLEKFIRGSAAGILNSQSNFSITNSLTVFSIKNLQEELRPVAMHVILDFVWTRVKKTLKKRILILDEAWYMMKYQDSASFVYSIVKRARKYYLGVTTATQDVEDFLKTEYGKAVLTNSSIQVLLKQGTAEVDIISETFYLSEGERELLLSADVGEGLFFAGQNHVAIKILAAEFENELITSNPMEVLKRQEAEDEAEEENKNQEQTVQLPSSPPVFRNPTQTPPQPVGQQMPQTPSPSQKLGETQPQQQTPLPQPHMTHQTPSPILPPTPTLFGQQQTTQTPPSQVSNQQVAPAPTPIPQVPLSPINSYNVSRTQSSLPTQPIPTHPQLQQQPPLPPVSSQEQVAPVPVMRSANQFVQPTSPTPLQPQTSLPIQQSPQAPVLPDLSVKPPLFSPPSPNTTQIP